MTAAVLGRRLRLPAAAAYLGMTARELTYLVQQAAIPAHRLRARGWHFFYEAELDAWLETTTHGETVARRPSTKAVDHLVAGRELLD